MQIRPATDHDIPNIVELLKISLGESLMPKSERYWSWKHIENPFGASPVLIAEEDGRLIGVRAFMRWQWSDHNRVYHTVRAVDTATHPQYQGKGIFKKLTLQLIDYCKQDAICFIYNTPNAKSRPGYLKMGWKDAGRLPVQFYPVSFSWLLQALFNKKPSKEIEVCNDITYLLEDDRLQRLLEKNNKHLDAISTFYTLPYLRWRYRDVPIIQYQGFEYQDQMEHVVIIGRIKSSRIGNEFRITDFFSTEKVITPDCKKAFISYSKNKGADYITCSGTLEGRLSIGMTFNRGPITTIRDVNMKELSRLENFKAWAPGLGDLELF